MDLGNKKVLASKALGIGINRIAFNLARLNEIKEAITKQDIRDLYADGAIIIKPVKGRAKVEKRKIRRHHGSIKRPVKDSKQQYVKLTRKLRRYLKELKLQEKLNDEEFAMLRKEVKAKQFRSKAHLKERLVALKEK